MADEPPLVWIDEDELEAKWVKLLPRLFLLGDKFALVSAPNSSDDRSEEKAWLASSFWASVSAITLRLCRCGVDGSSAMSW